MDGSFYLEMKKKGKVIRSTGSWYILKNEDGSTIDARIRGKFKIQGIKTTNPLAVGDWVLYNPEGDNAIITDILPRKNYVIRKSVNLSKQAHIIASNIDLALLVVTVSEPRTSLGFIDRFLITCEAYDIPVMLVFNKIDILNLDEQILMEAYIEIYQQVGYQCFKTSANNGKGIDAVKSAIKNKVTMFSGHSGAGKSSLVNALDDSIDTKIGDLSEVHFKGKHTTTFAELFTWSFGGEIIDTPGIKGLGLIDMKKEHISHYFKEMSPLIQECKFNNCIHMNEPGCAVKEAVENEEIPIERYESYVGLIEEDNENPYRTDIYS